MGLTREEEVTGRREKLDEEEGRRGKQ